MTFSSFLEGQPLPSLGYISIKEAKEDFDKRSMREVYSRHTMNAFPRQLLLLATLTLLRRNGVLVHISSFPQR